MAVGLADLDLLLPGVPCWTERSTENLVRARGILAGRPDSALAAVHLPKITAELARRAVSPAPPSPTRR